MQPITMLLVLIAFAYDSEAHETSRTVVQYNRTPSRPSNSVHRQYRTPRKSRSYSAGTSSFDWSETVGNTGMRSFSGSSGSLGSTLSATFDDLSNSVSSFFSAPRVHQMRSRCSPEDIPTPTSTWGIDTNTILRTIVSRALDCDPQYGSTDTFKACLVTSFPDLAPSDGCYDCITEFVEKFRPHCPSRSDSCVRKTTKDLWDICSP